MEELAELFAANMKEPIRMYRGRETSTWVRGSEPIRTVKRYFKGLKRSVEYLNVPAAFDIETTSINGAQKAACMYVWQFGILGRCCYGRTWDEFLQLLSDLQELLNLSDTRRLMVYVHNLEFEFQFMRKWMEWPEVFATGDRRPVKAFCQYGVEFRCSYILTNEPLQRVAKNLMRCPVEKLVGDLDYTLIRHSKTPLTDAELCYCHNDILVVMSLILDKIYQDGDILNIPLTKTGYVRRHVRKQCLYDKTDHKKNARKYLRYRDIMKALSMSEMEYKQCKRAFQGGFTHASAVYSGQILQGVDSWDIASSYPAAMCSELYPMSRATAVYEPSDEFVQHALTHYCCMLDVEFFVLHACQFSDHPLSESKCQIDGNFLVDNGRIVYADYVKTTFTDVDMTTLRHFYTWEGMHVKMLRYYLPGYLPKEFILAVLGLYHDKTTLKGIAGREADYMQAKGNINSCYGMAVTDIVRDELVYTDDWIKREANAEDQIRHYNSSPQRFLFYPWGVWVTAYARRNLFAAIEECGTDYVYSDTDNVKILNGDRHRKWFEWYSGRIGGKLRRMCRLYGIDEDLTAPLDPKGVRHPLGVFEYEGRYDYFKTLGAKRYLTLKNGRLSLTCAGVNKKAAEWLKNSAEGEIEAFSTFADGLYIPAGQTGKLTHTYIDEEMRGLLTDYTGRAAEYHERSGIHLSGADYSLSLSVDYLNYLLGFKEVQQ